jgi:hypothetical protein
MKKLVVCCDGMYFFFQYSLVLLPILEDAKIHAEGHYTHAALESITDDSQY